MEKRKIGIDIDEVVVEFVNPYLKIYNQKYNRKKRFEDINNFDLWIPLGITKEDAFEITYKFYDSEDFDNIPFVNGAREGIKRLTKDNELFFITSRPLKIKEKTEQFFRKNFPELNYEIIFSGDIWGSQEKKKPVICKRLCIENIIEDNINYAFDCAKSGIITYLLNKPWNQNGNLPKNIIRVKSWNEILERLES